MNDCEDEIIDWFINENTGNLDLNLSDSFPITFRESFPLNFDVIQRRAFFTVVCKKRIPTTELEVVRIFLVGKKKRSGPWCRFDGSLTENFAAENFLNFD